MKPEIPSPQQLNDLTQLAAILDASTHDERVSWMRTLGRSGLSRLYELAESAPPLTLSHFHDAPGRAVIHHGQNSLAVFSSFQKRVVDNAGVVQGYNHQSMAWFTGPGHFTLAQDGNEVVFDYTKEPASAFEGFPPLKSNTSGFSTFVYGHMIDRVRRVSRHCVVGAAFKKGKPFDAWFMLIREGESDASN